jgi:hypothetical protein
VIFVKVDGMVGSTHEEWATECLALAKKLGVGVHIEVNQVQAIVFPTDTVPEILKRYFQLVEILRH